MAALMVRGVARVLSVLALVVVLAACQAADPPREPTGPSKAENTAEMTRVIEQARALGGVTVVEGGYDTSLTAYGQTGLTATVPAGTPQTRAEELADELVALVWRSRLDPIATLGATVLVPGADPIQPPLAGRFIQTREGFDRLAATLGPRPTS